MLDKTLQIRNVDHAVFNDLKFKQPEEKAAVVEDISDAPMQNPDEKHIENVI